MADNYDTEHPPEVVVKPSRAISLVWFIPVLALMLGGWLYYKNLQDKGPKITITFENAEGIEAGKTKIKYKNIEVGLVEDVTFEDDLKGVIVSARMNSDLRSHLNESTRFWIVKPRVGAQGVSGLNTLLSGAFIGIDVSTDGAKTDHFTGLEKPPLRTSDVPGLEVTLQTENFTSLLVGSPVYYKSFKAGKVENITLDENYEHVLIDVFIEAPYDRLVTTRSRFWNISGVSIDVSADGLSVEFQSLESLILGGIAFDSSSELTTGESVADGAQFPLYKNLKSVDSKVYTDKKYFVLNFEDSIRGLKVGAVVDFKGIQVGEVVSIEGQYDKLSDLIRIPVLIQLEAQRVGLASEISTPEEDLDIYYRYIKKGMRAKLQTGSLLTGQLFVELDFYPDAAPFEPTFSHGYPELPTIPSDLGKIKEDVTSFLDKVNQLDLQEIVDNLNLTLDQLRGTISNTDVNITAVIENLDKTLSDARVVIKSLDEDSITRYNLNELMKEVQQAARSVRNLTEQIEKNPSSVIFGRKSTQSKQ